MQMDLVNRMTYEAAALVVVCITYMLRLRRVVFVCQVGDVESGLIGFLGLL
jgi:hypothetical protein